MLGALYERIYDTLRGRGVPPPDESVLWACLARLKDPATGVLECVCVCVRVAGCVHMMHTHVNCQMPAAAQLRCRHDVHLLTRAYTALPLRLGAVSCSCETLALRVLCPSQQLC